MIKRFLIVVLLLGFSGVLQSAELKPYTDKAPIPPLTLQDLQGKTHNLNDYKGRSCCYSSGQRIVCPVEKKCRQ